MELIGKNFSCVRRDVAPLACGCMKAERWTSTMMTIYKISGSRVDSSAIVKMETAAQIIAMPRLKISVSIMFLMIINRYITYWPCAAFSYECRIFNTSPVAILGQVFSMVT